MSDSFESPFTGASQAPLFMVFTRQEHWSGLTCPPSGDFPNPGIETTFKKYKLIYFNWRLITLKYFIGFAIHQHESTTGVHAFPILNLPPNIPPYTIPLSRPNAPALSVLYHALNLDW